MAVQQYGAVMEEWPNGSRWTEADVRDALRVAHLAALRFLDENPGSKVRSIKLFVAPPGSNLDDPLAMHRVAWKVEVEE